MILSPSQISELSSIADKYMHTFVAKRIGAHVLTPEQNRVLRSIGININASELTVQQAFKFGMLSSAVSEAKAKAFTYESLKQSLKSGSFFPLSNVEKRMVEVLERQAAKDVRTMSSRIKSSIDQKLYDIENGVINHHKVVTDNAKRAIFENKTLRQLSSDIAEESDRWGKNFDTMADYVMHEAFNKGRVAQYQRDGENKVYFDVYLGACKHCVRLYLTGGIGSKPKIFTIPELESNGSNVGRKAIEWKPTVGPTHPHCRCTINNYSEGWVWNENTRTFEQPKSFERKVQRKSRVKVTVGDKETTI